MDDATAGLLQTDQARELIEAVNEQLGSETIQFYPGSGHRHLMVWVGGKVRSVCMDPQLVVGRGVADSLPNGDGADVLRRLMEASIVILREHPVNRERQAEGLKPANCLWLWGQGRAPVWPPITERYQLRGSVIASSDVHRGVGISAGLDSLDLSQDEASSSSPYSRYGEGMAQELVRKDFLYVHAGLADDILHSSDAKRKVHAVEQFDRDMVGPVLQELGKHKDFRLLVICDSGLPVSNGRPTVPPMYAYSDGPLHQSAGVKRLDEMTVKTQDGSSRDATKFPGRLFSRGS
jgi:2,3-bisphosphoglycerate-independent phosphoglycerate mutase